MAPTAIALAGNPLRVIIGTSGNTSGDEPLTCETNQQTPDAGTYWLLRFVAVSGFLAKRGVIDTASPAIGIFIVPVNAPVESLADAQSNPAPAYSPGINLNARGIIVPMECSSPALPAGGFALSCTMDSGAAIPIPQGWTIRAIYNCYPGTPAPGPGALSQCTLIATVEVVTEAVLDGSGFNTLSS